MAKEKMSEAEKYRLERKKRIEKEKKKKNSYINRNRQQVQKIEKTLGIVAGVAVVVVVLCLILNYFGVFNRMITAAKVNGQSVSVAEMNCAYSDVKNQVYSASQQYEQSYGSGFYTSDTKSTDTCVYDSSKTWGEYFEEQALEHIKQVYTYKDAEGSTLTEDQQKEITETFDTLAESAKNNEFSLNAYIREVYGIGVNKTLLRSWLENIYKAQNAQEAVQTKYEESITDEQIKQFYKEHKDSYTTATVKAYTIAVDTSALDASSLSEDELTNEKIDELLADAVKTAKKNATSLYNSIKANPSNFVKLVNAYEKKQNGENATDYSDDSVTLSGVIAQSMTSLGSDAKLWIANSKSANQTGVVYSADYDNKSFQYDVILVVTPAQNYYTVNVRHILIEPTDTSDDASWDEAKEQIDTIYDQWKKKPTEEYFATLAGENSADPGSKDNGGLYENVTPGQMVDTFNDWCFDSSRKAGDTGIVKTSYGYHLMYFVSNNGAYWKTQVPTDMAEDYLNTTVQEELDAINVDKVNFGWNRVKDVKDYIQAQKTTTTTAEETSAAE